MKKIRYIRDGSMSLKEKSEAHLLREIMVMMNRRLLKVYQQVCHSLVTGRSID